MKQLLAWIAALFGGGKKKPPVIIQPPEDKPHVFTWPDKRAIGMVMFSNYKEWTDTDNYMTDDFAGFAKQCIPQLKAINAQGVIVWDAEGSKFPRAYTYYGDPKMAPEKVDSFFAQILAAGFRTGVCLRPDQIKWIYNEQWGRELPEHIVVASPFENLVHKVEYARQRWGCTLFYVDSNIGVGQSVGSVNTVGYGQLMPANIFAELHKTFPDCLFIPEWHNQEYHQCCMPYYHSALEQWRLPQRGGFVVPCGDTPWTVDELKQVISMGNILLPRVWYESPELSKIKTAYENK